MLELETENKLVVKLDKYQFFYGDNEREYKRRKCILLRENYLIN